MRKKNQNEFDPRKHFSALPQHRGPVQQDSDWNNSSRKVSFRRGLRRLAIVTVLAVAGLALLLFMYNGAIVNNSNNLSALVVLTRPTNGAVLPLHGTFSVNGEAASRSGVSELQLIVNGQPWGAKTFEVSLPAAQSSWQWTPSGEGTHELFVRAIDGTGRVFESNRVRILATAQADVRFPLQYSAAEGDTVNSLAESAEIDPQEILDANPGLDPEAPLLPGSPLTIPVHVPNAPPVQPESGAPAAPPIEPLPDTKDNPLTVIDAGLQLVSGEEKSDNSSGFFFSDGKVIPGQLVDQLYLYVSVNGETPWWRIPEEPMTFLSPQMGGFDISAYLNLAELEALPNPVSLEAEAWGWQGGNLIFLGSYHGMIGGGLRAWPPKNTALKIVAYEALGMPEFVHEINLSGEDPSLAVEFDWTTSAPDVTSGRWQVSTEPFPSNPNLFPNGLVQQGIAKGSQGRFEIDFGRYFQMEDFWGKLSGELGDAFDFLGGQEQQEEPLMTFWNGAPLTFYVRILPLKGDMSFAPEPTGGTSNLVVVRYLPSGEMLAETVTPGGPVYETQIVEFIPYRASDPAYGSCTVLAQDITFKGGYNSSVIPAGTQSCGCPGVSCGGGGSSCSLDPGDWGDCASDAFDAVGDAFTGLYEFGANLYNGAKKFVVDTLSAGLCDENFLGAAIPKDECKLLVEIGVNAGLAAMGLPPEIPNFEALFDEGLEYAVASLASQITGFECDETCRALLKKAYQGASNPEQLYEEGLLYGASLAADELGVDCDADCQSVIQQGVQGKLNAGDLTDEALEALAKDIAQKLRDQQHECDANCEAKIAEALKKGDSLGQAVASTASQPPPEPLWVPHPLAMEQPPIAKVEVFRRWESAQLDPTLIAERCSGFTIDNSALNTTYSMSLTGRVFEPRAVEVPLLEPGGSFRIPVVLHPASWYLPQGFSDPLDPFLLGYQEVGEEDGQTLGQVQQGLGNPQPFQSYWRVLYYGSQIDLKVFGPFMLDVIDGEMMSFPCFSEDMQTYSIPMP